MSVGSLGAGSGIDLESLVNQMVSAQKDVKVKLYQDKINDYEAELSALGKVGSAIDNFKSSVKALNDDEALYWSRCQNRPKRRRRSYCYHHR
ncbi:MULTISPECIES: flagellar cap protein FliD N-terminal domain-containing protein [Marinomonas]|uniref:Flagellar hook-associated protein 2 N-terminal domain-containing protein n=1 Tax=Marinomonas rhodophyticola TaxID=2992803 RepID=A0ABT3KFC7_9GAMM|nr:flagellar cap protein FliD N-terminal domain-containing protein [Marinomonas sp. KJ51-3]MCW4629249.1 hypothetical protein [Marinomonas sp. KJ51-3]